MAIPTKIPLQGTLTKEKGNRVFLNATIRVILPLERVKENLSHIPKKSISNVQAKDVWAPIPFLTFYHFLFQRNLTFKRHKLLLDDNCLGESWWPISDSASSNYCWSCFQRSKVLPPSSPSVAAKTDFKMVRLLNEDEKDDRWKYQCPQYIPKGTPNCKIKKSSSSSWWPTHRLQDSVSTKAYVLWKRIPSQGSKISLLCWGVFHDRWAILRTILKGSWGESRPRRICRTRESLPAKNQEG